VKLERIKEFLVYDPVTGEIKNLRGRSISPDEDGYVLITDPKDKKKKKFRFAYLCWAMGNGRFPEASEKIIHRNLNKQDTSLCNLYLVSNEEYKKYKNAHKNLTGGIRLSLHPSDTYCYRVHWFEGTTEKTQVVYDIVVAKRLETKLRLRFSKILTKYCYSEP